MSQFRQDLSTERMGIELVKPLIQSWAVDGTGLMWTNDANESELWQRTWGDVLYTDKHDGKHRAVEIKAETRFTRNLFIESWSNKTFTRKRPGWMHTLNSDILLTVWLDQKYAIKVEMQKLFAWFFDLNNVRMYREIEVNQSRNGDQLNRTTGYAVPIVRIAETCGGIVYRHDGKEWAVIDYQAELAAEKANHTKDAA